MYPGIYPLNTLGWGFSVKKPGFLLKVFFFDKTFIIFYKICSYYTFEVMGNSKFQYEVGLRMLCKFKKHPFIILAMSYFSAINSPTLNLFMGFLKYKHECYT